MLIVLNYGKLSLLIRFVEVFGFIYLYYYNFVLYRFLYYIVFYII